MPEGIIATVEDGFATIDFVNPELRGPALAALLELGGPGTIETISRRGPRRLYRVPEGNAEEVGLLDGDEGPATWSAGADTGRAAALKAADPNVVGGDDWHTPILEHSSRNAYVGTVANEDVLDRTQVYTGSAHSFGGHAVAPTSTDLLDGLDAIKYPQPPEEVPPGEGEGEGEGDGEGDGEGIEGMSAQRVNLGLAEQTSGLASDPGATPEVGGEALGEFTTVQSTRVEDAAAYPEGEPSEDWKRAELDAYAAAHGLDTTKLANKGEVLAAINEAADGEDDA
ncbi:hypothetical protein THORA_14 [Mycobacterium phage Thora]|uniref:Uncharacterized protein n=1 Tax=Mycobacterium phage Thora TaxID=1032894 RepID=G1D9L8_9CAUD|nr:hypothetical protein THORA_14 [Mycobacterium phage Thora]AZS32349.1 hypothetical protein SEA_SOLOSIS_13 [Mycobacterium phage Solosis]